MAIAHRRAWVMLLAVGLVATATFAAAPPAEAATCVNVPGSTPGLNLSIGGQPQRVPGVSEVSVCADTGYVPLVSVTLDGRGYCTWGCFSVVAQGGSVKPPALTINYKLDGVLTSTTVGGGTGGPGTETCLLSVGGRQAPYPTCQGFGLGIDQDDPTQGVLETVQQQVEWAEATAWDVAGDLGGTVAGLQQFAIDTVNAVSQDITELQGDIDELVAQVEQIGGETAATVCNTFPPVWVEDGWNYREVRFCDEPVLWTQTMVEQVEGNVCGVLPPQDDPTTHWDDEIYFCDSAGAWAEAFVRNTLIPLINCEGSCTEPPDVLSIVCTFLRDNTAIRCNIATD